MKSMQNIEKSIRALHDSASVDMDKRVLRDTLRALERSQEKTSAPQANIFKSATKTQIWASAAAAVIIVGIFIGICMFSGRGKQPGKEIIQSRFLRRGDARSKNKLAKDKISPAATDESRGSAKVNK